MGGRDLPARRRRCRTAPTITREVRRPAPDRSRSPSPPWPPTARCCCSACPAPRRPGSPSTWPRRSAATPPCSCRAPPARPRRRSATAGTTRGCWPTARREDALVPSPVMRAMRDRRDRPDRGAHPHAGRRAGHADHDPVGEDAADPGARRARCRPSKGFNVIATANDRDRGVNDLSSALRRRFNTVVLPLPGTAEEEVDDRLPAASSQLGRALELPEVPAARWRRSAAWSRCSASCASGADRGRPDQAQDRPAAPCPPAEAISVVTSGMALAAHFGDGALRAGRRRRRHPRRGREGPRPPTAWSGRSTWRPSSASRDGWTRLLPRLPRGQRLMTACTAARDPPPRARIGAGGRGGAGRSCSRTRSSSRARPRPTP